jgi:cytochrome c
MIVLRLVVAAAFGMLTALSAWAADGNPTNGERLFGTCAACHSLEPNRNMTGPSLANLWNRKAGGLVSFPRYSPALELSGVTWDDKTLDEWLKDPQYLIPGNTMTFPGIKNAQQRADLLAFLKEATKPGHAPTAARRGGQMGEMGGGMGGMISGAVPNLKAIQPEDRVQSIRYCGDTYKVTTADGNTRDFWERNLRLKTDSSVDGPQQGAPALVGAGMMGDRADVIFSAPEEIGGFIQHQC